MSGKMITVNTSCGAVRGCLTDEGMRVFRGVPYGQAERFCPPEPVRWEETLDCREFREKAMQPDRLGVYPAGVSPVISGGENCLCVNIWGPQPREGETLPVVLYVHGGAFQVGSAQEASRAGDLFMENDRMVFVSVEYRLGVLGFLQLGEEMGEKYRHSGSCGALDVLAAIHWVHENIAAFGGDPDRVTLFGISAGAKMIGSLLTVPGMGELCSQIVLESGAMQSFRTRETARAVAKDYERLLGIGSEEELISLPAEKLVKAQAEFCSTPGSTCFFGPVLDGGIFDENWKETLVSGRGWKGRAVLGSGLRELGEMAASPAFPEIRETALRNLFGLNAAEAQARFDDLPGDDSREKWTRVLSDFMYRSYTDSLAARLSGLECPVWVYSFEYLPAVHGMGFSFLMGELDRQGAPVSGEEIHRRRAVSDAMRHSVRRFICTGTPEEAEIWPQYEGRRKMVFDAAPHMEERPEDSLRGLPEMVYIR